MPIWTTEGHTEADMRASVAREDPWRMFLVVRYKQPLWPAELPALCARATMELVEGPLARDPEHGPALEAWRTIAFGKVTLRANEKLWARAQDELAGVTVADAAGTPLVRAVVPARRSARPALLDKLQTLDALPDEHPAPEGTPPAPHPDAATYLARASLGMSLGKLCAQASHAAMLLADGEPARRAPQRRARWEAAGWPGECRSVSDAEWDRTVRDHDVVAVQDAGFTEVAPGSLTVLGLFCGR